MGKYRPPYVPNPLQKAHLQLTVTKILCLSLSFLILPAYFCWFSLVLLCCKTEKSLSSPSHCAACGVRIHCRISPPFVPLLTSPRLFNHSWCTSCFRYLVLFSTFCCSFLAGENWSCRQYSRCCFPNKFPTMLCFPLCAFLTLHSPSTTECWADSFIKTHHNPETSSA